MKNITAKELKSLAEVANDINFDLYKAGIKYLEERMEEEFMLNHRINAISEGETEDGLVVSIEVNKVRFTECGLELHDAETDDWYASEIFSLETIAGIFGTIDWVSQSYK